jgi:hypothetical protein
VLIVLVCLAGRAAATEGLNVSPDVPPVPVNQPGLLVLKSGRTIAGRISQSANGYTVDQVHGTIAVPFDLVEFFARDEREALRLFHKRTPNPTAGFHVRLAEWCLPYQLLAEARDELRAALLLEPHRGDARNLLRRLDALLEPPPPVEAAARGRLEAAGFDVPEATSLAGLSPESAREFTERVQPLLMNKCGNATCHGPAAENDFRLARVRLTGGAHRVHSERNLAAVLEYIDRQNPNRSPLLTVSQGNHGRAGRTIFSGPFGAEQLETLRAWVLHVGRERAAIKAGDRAGFSAAAPTTARAAEPAGGGPMDSAGAAGPAGIEETRIHAPGDAPASPPADAFDPRAFNRSLEGGAGES